jgi:hypothetical protein
MIPQYIAGILGISVLHIVEICHFATAPAGISADFLTVSRNILADQTVELLAVFIDGIISGSCLNAVIQTVTCAFNLFYQFFP